MMHTVDFIVIPISRFSLEYLGVCYLKSFLDQEGISSNIHVVYPEDIGKINELFAGYIPKLIGLAMYTGNNQYVCEAATILKQHYPDCHITVGGPSTLNETIHILKDNTAIDTVVTGEGEEIVLQLAQHVFNDISLKECLGITFRDPELGIIKNPDRIPPQDLDKIPFPDRSLFEKYPAPMLRIVGSRGCSGFCTFCDGAGCSAHLGSRVRTRSMKNVVDEIETLQKKHHINTFIFSDSTFDDPSAGGKMRLEDFIHEVSCRKLSIGFGFGTRAELIDESYRNYFKQLFDIGLESLLIGIESGNEHDLRLYGKKATLSDNIRAIRIAKESGIYLSIGFINFNPYSTFDSLNENAEFLYINGLGYLLSTYITPLRVYPQAAIKHKLIKDKLMDESADYATGIFDYRYVNDTIAILANSLLRNINMQSLYQCVALDMQIGMLRSKIYKHKDLYLDKRIEDIFLRIDHLYEHENQNNYHFFKKCLELCQNGINDKALESYCQEMNSSLFVHELTTIYQLLTEVTKPLFNL